MLSAGPRARTVWISVASRPTAISNLIAKRANTGPTLGGKPATAFLLKLISMLQFSGTVPMIDVTAYAQWLSK